MSGLVHGGLGCSLRLATVYGPWEDGPRAIPSFIRAYLANTRPTLHGSGEDVRDYVCVEDVAATLVRAALAEPGALGSRAGVFNVGSGIGRRTSDVLRAVAGAMGVEPVADLVPSTREPSHLVLDSTLASETFGINFTRDFDAEIRKEVRWLRARTA